MSQRNRDQQVRATYLNVEAALDNKWDGCGPVCPWHRLFHVDIDVDYLQNAEFRANPQGILAAAHGAALNQSPRLAGIYEKATAIHEEFSKPHGSFARSVRQRQLAADGIEPVPPRGNQFHVRFWTGLPGMVDTAQTTQQAMSRNIAERMAETEIRATEPGSALNEQQVSERVKRAVAATAEARARVPDAAGLKGEREVVACCACSVSHQPFLIGLIRYLENDARVDYPFRRGEVVRATYLDAEAALDADGSCGPFCVWHGLFHVKIAQDFLIRYGYNEKKPLYEDLLSALQTEVPAALARAGKALPPAADLRYLWIKDMAVRFISLVDSQEWDHWAHVNSAPPQDPPDCEPGYAAETCGGSVECGFAGTIWCKPC